MLVQNIYWTLMIGFVVGALTRVFFKQMIIGEVFSAMTMGLVGSVMFGWLGSVIGFYEYGDFKGLAASTLGAIIMVSFFVWRYKQSKLPKE